jgi:hypothetical protein
MVPPTWCRWLLDMAVASPADVRDYLEEVPFDPEGLYRGAPARTPAPTTQGTPGPTPAAASSETLLSPDDILVKMATMMISSAAEGDAHPPRAAAVSPQSAAADKGAAPSTSSKSVSDSTRTPAAGKGAAPSTPSGSVTSAARTFTGSNRAGPSSVSGSTSNGTGGSAAAGHSSATVTVPAAASDIEERIGLPKVAAGTSLNFVCMEEGNFTLRANFGGNATVEVRGPTGGLLRIERRIDYHRLLKDAAEADIVLHVTIVIDVSNGTGTPETQSSPSLTGTASNGSGTPEGESSHAVTTPAADVEDKIGLPHVAAGTTLLFVCTEEGRFMMQSNPPGNPIVEVRGRTAAALRIERKMDYHRLLKEAAEAGVALDVTIGNYVYHVAGGQGVKDEE